MNMNKTRAGPKFSKMLVLAAIIMLAGFIFSGSNQLDSTMVGGAQMVEPIVAEVASIPLVYGVPAPPGQEMNFVFATASTFFAATSEFVEMFAPYVVIEGTIVGIVFLAMSLMIAAVVIRRQNLHLIGFAILTFGVVLMLMSSLTVVVLPTLMIFMGMGFVVFATTGLVLRKKAHVEQDRTIREMVDDYPDENQGFVATLLRSMKAKKLSPYNLDHGDPQALTH